MITFLAFVTLGFAPGIFWLWQLYQRDRYIPAPPHLVVRTFLWGIAIAVPVVLVEWGFTAVAGIELGEMPASGLAQAAYGAFVVAGMTEELAKFLVIRLTIFRSPYFRQPLDGIIFSAAAALGFASIENVGYMASFGAAVIIIRGPFSTVAHVLFSAVWGYTLGIARQRPIWPQAVQLALLAAMALHGLFDFLLFTGYGLWALLLFFAMGGALVLLLKVAQRQSPYRNSVAALLVTCANCGHQSGYGASFCITCGHALALVRANSALLCGHCRSQVSAPLHFCTACGSRLDRKLATTQT